VLHFSSHKHTISSELEVKREKNWSVSCSVAVFTWESAFKKTERGAFTRHCVVKRKLTKALCPLETNQKAM